MTDPSTSQDAIPFEFFASFKRIKKGNPIIALPPPLWAAATDKHPQSCYLTK